MSRFGHDAAHRENAFSLTFPEKRAVELRLADKRAWLITNIDEVGGDHRDGKRDRDRVAFGDLSARRLDHNAAGIGFCIRCFFFLFFVLREGCDSDAKRENTRERNENASASFSANGALVRSAWGNAPGIRAIIGALKARFNTEVSRAFSARAFASCTWGAAPGYR